MEFNKGNVQAAPTTFAGKKNKLEVKVYFSTSEALYALIGDLIHYILLLFEVKK